MIYRPFLEALTSLRSRVLRTLSPTPAAANLEQLHSNGRALLVDQLKLKYAPVFGDEWESRISAQDRAKMRYWELRGATRLARRKPKLIHGDNWEAAALAKQNQEQACNTAPALKARPFLLEELGIKPATPSQMNTIKARHDVFERHCIDIHNQPPGTQKALQAEIDALFQQLQALRSPEERAQDDAAASALRLKSRELDWGTHQVAKRYGHDPHLLPKGFVRKHRGEITALLEREKPDLIRRMDKLRFPPDGSAGLHLVT